MLSRWPIEEQAVRELPCVDPYSKLVLHARTCLIDVFSVHLTSAPEGAGVRERQAVQLDEFVQSRSDPGSPLPPIIAGDFNATPSSSPIRFLRGEQSFHGRSTFYQDAWGVTGDAGPGHTWSRLNPHTPPAYLYDARCAGLPHPPHQPDASPPLISQDSSGMPSRWHIAHHVPRSARAAGTECQEQGRGAVG